MTTTTDITKHDRALNIISALPRYIKASIEINGTTDGFVPIHHLDLTLCDLMVAFAADVVRINDLSASLVDTQIVFVKYDVITIYNCLQSYSCPHPTP